MQRELTFASESKPTGIQWPEISGRQLEKLSDPRAFFQERIGHDDWNVEVMRHGRTVTDTLSFAGGISLYEGVWVSSYPFIALSPSVRGLNLIFVINVS